MSTEGHAISRRTLLRGAGLLGLGGLVSGCGSAFASGVAGIGPPKNTLSYWNLFGGGDGVRMLTMQQGYQKQHPGINLDAVTLAWGNPYYTKLSLATLGSRPPDVGISHLTRASILAHAGLLEPLNESELAPYGAHRRQLHARGVEQGAHERNAVRDPARHAPVRDVLQHRHLQEGRAAQCGWQPEEPG